MAATSALSEPAKENETTVRIFMSRRLQDPCARHLPQASQFLLPAFPKRVTYRERCAVKTPNPVDIAGRESRQTDQQRVKGKFGEGLSSLYNHHQTPWATHDWLAGCRGSARLRKLLAAIYFQFFLGRKPKPGGMESGAAKGCEGRGTRHNNNLYSWLSLGS